MRATIEYYLEACKQGRMEVERAGEILMNHIEHNTEFLKNENCEACTACKNTLLEVVNQQ